MIRLGWIQQKKKTKKHDMQTRGQTVRDWTRHRHSVVSHFLSFLCSYLMFAIGSSRSCSLDSSNCIADGFIPPPYECMVGELVALPASDPGPF